jgi:hypothetical protein
VIFVLAALGALTAAVAFPRRTTQPIELEPAPSLGPVVPETDGRARLGCDLGATAQPRSASLGI